MECDEIWHAGDIGDIAVMDQLKKIAPVRAVYGNIDNHIVRAEYPEHNRFTLEGVDVWMTHIGGKPYGILVFYCCSFLFCLIITFCIFFSQQSILT